MFKNISYIIYHKSYIVITKVIYEYHLFRNAIQINKVFYLNFIFFLFEFENISILINYMLICFRKYFNIF